MQSSFLFKRVVKKIPSGSRGFGLVELLVAIGVMVLVTTVVAVNQNTFNGVVLLENQAYELATDIQSVQVRAVGTQNVNINSSSWAPDPTYRQSLGVRLYEGQRVYDFVRELSSGDLVVFGAGGRIDPRFTITDITGYGSYGNPEYDGSGGLNIMFRRPKFDASFFQSDGTPLGSDINQVNISIQANNDDTSDVTRTRDVVITSTGQVTVSNPGS